MARGNSSSSIAVRHMKAAPMPMAVKPARRAAMRVARARRQPTRTVAAKPMPSGTMKVSEGMVMAI